MTENQNKISKKVSRLVDWLLAVFLSVIITTAWYQIGYYLHNNFEIDEFPQQWGIPVVFIVSLLCILGLLKLFPLEKIKVQVHYIKRVLLFFAAILVIILILFLTRYKVVNTEGVAFYKINRWTGTTYFIRGNTEKKVERRQ